MFAARNCSLLQSRVNWLECTHIKRVYIVGSALYARKQASDRVNDFGAANHSNGRQKIEIQSHVMGQLSRNELKW